MELIARLDQYHHWRVQVENHKGRRAYFCTIRHGGHVYTKYGKSAERAIVGACDLAASGNAPKLKIVK